MTELGSGKTSDSGAGHFGLAVFVVYVLFSIWAVAQRKGLLSVLAPVPGLYLPVAASNPLVVVCLKINFLCGNSAEEDRILIILMVQVCREIIVSSCFVHWKAKNRFPKPKWIPF